MLSFLQCWSSWRLTTPLSTTWFLSYYRNLQNCRHHPLHYFPILNFLYCKSTINFVRGLTTEKAVWKDNLINPSSRIERVLRHRNNCDNSHLTLTKHNFSFVVAILCSSTWLKFVWCFQSRTRSEQEQSDLLQTVLKLRNVMNPSVFKNRRFGTTYRSFLGNWLLKMRQIVPKHRFLINLLSITTKETEESR